MLNYKSTREMKPLYDYYVETDLDSVDDQPVDYSKRYADQDSDEMCCSSRKKRHLSTPSVPNFNSNKEPDDELKSYHIEGTPLIISSSSSFCDLREICTPETDNHKQQFGKRPLSLPGCLNVNNSPDKMSIEAGVQEKQESVKRRQKELNGQSENFSTENEHFSKVSSPIMFSRSSSICSLNSFEQNSIVDDRSSVSIFSTFPSGIISPSDIPDSPGEAMSPFINKTKQQEFVFPPSNNEKSMEPTLAKLKADTSQQYNNAFDDISEDDIKVYNIEGSCTPMSCLSALSFQTHSDYITVDQTPSLRIHSSISKINASKIEEEIDEPNINREDCKDTDMKSIPVLKTSLPMFFKDSNSNDVSSSTGFNYTKLTSAGGGCIVNGIVPCKDVNFSNLPVFERKQIKAAVPFVDFKETTDFSKDNSDDECRDFSKEMSDEECKDLSDEESDALLEECIKSGMPGTGVSNLMDPKPTFKSTQSNQVPYLFETVEDQNSYSDKDESEDESDILIKSCVQLGMPQKTDSNQTQDQMSMKYNSQLHKCKSDEYLDRSSRKTICPDLLAVNRQRNLSKTFAVNHQRNLSKTFAQANNIEKNSNVLKQGNLELDDEVHNQCIELGITADKTLKEGSNAASSITVAIMKNKSQEITPRKSDDESDGDENDILVQQCIQLGMPRFGAKESATKQSPNPISYPGVNAKHLTYRNTYCPDGMSDDEENDDDNIVNECIKAGMPSARSPDSNLKTQCKSPKSPFFKSQSPRKPSAYEERAMYLKKYCYDNVIQSSGFLRDTSISPAEPDDSPCVYRTEDTPILSPTASISDLSILSFTEEKVCQESFLNNSRNSNCSSDSEDDELLLQCIRSGMPGVRRAVS